MTPQPKSHTEYLWFNATSRKQLFHITDEVRRVVMESRVSEGFCLVGAMHITAAVWVNDNESGLHATSMSGLRSSPRSAPTTATTAPVRTTVTRT